MGELERAFKANDTAIDMCSNDDKMVLHEQRMKFIEEVTKPNSESALETTPSCLRLVQPVVGCIALNS